MELPKILLKGKFRPEDLIVSVSESNRKINPEIEAKLEAIWEEKKKRADENGQNCYNGISYRVNSLTQQKGKIIIDFGTFEYKVRDGLIDVPEYFDLPEAYWRKGALTGGSVKTLDDRYAMVELSGKSMNKNRIDLPGGIMETNIPMNSGEDVFESFYVELEEEIGVMKEDIQECFLKVILIEKKTNVGFYFEVLLKLTAAELEERFKSNQDQDIKKILFFTKVEYLETLKQHSSPNKQLIPEFLEI